MLDQGYPRLEYIVQDGASTDGSRAILERYRDRLSHFESVPDRGQAHAVNLGLRRARGEILAYLNADDLLLPGALAAVAAAFASRPDLDALYGHRVVIDEDDLEVGRWVLPRHSDACLSWADYVPQESLFWRRRIWDTVGGALDESFHFALDWDLLLRFLDAGAKMMRLPRFLGAFRVHDEQKTSRLLSTVGAAEIERLRQRMGTAALSPLAIHSKLRRHHLEHAVLDRLHRWRILRH